MRKKKNRTPRVLVVAVQPAAAGPQLGTVTAGVWPLQSTNPRPTNAAGGGGSPGGGGFPWVGLLLSLGAVALFRFALGWGWVLSFVAGVVVFVAPSLLGMSA